MIDYTGMTAFEKKVDIIDLCNEKSLPDAKSGHGKCSKISNTRCLPKRPRQTVQTQIRLLLQKQSDQGLPCLLF